MPFYFWGTFTEYPDLEKVSPPLSLMGRRADTEISFIYFPADVVPYIQKG